MKLSFFVISFIKTFSGIICLFNEITGGLNKAAVFFNGQCYKVFYTRNLKYCIVSKTVRCELVLGIVNVQK
jgi:hypothetical protein